MKPVIQRELDEIRRMIADLEKRLKNENEQLGHRAIFAVGKRGEVPPPTAADRAANKVLGTTGWIAQTGGSGSGGGGLSTVVVDNLTIGGDGSVSSPLSASLLSGTIDARIKNLSGSITGKFNSLNFLSSVSRNSTLAGDGTPGNPLSAAPTFVAAQTAITSSIAGLSGTIDATLRAIFSSSQTWQQTANGTEGTTLTAVLPVPFSGPQYYAFITNVTGTNSPVYRIQNKNSASFQVVSTAPFSNGEQIDFLVISGGLGPVWDGSVIANLSGTIDARFFNLSGTIDARFAGINSGIATLSSSVTAINAAMTYDVDVTGTVDWFAFGASLTSNQLPRNLNTASTLHQKKNGPGLLVSPGIELVFNGVSLTTFTQAGSTTIRASNSNSTAIANYNSTTGWGMHTPGSLGAIGWGMKGGVFVPGDNVVRILKIYGNQFNCATDFVCSMFASPVTLTSTAVADVGGVGNTRQIVYEVSYSSPVGTWLYWNIAVTTNYSTTSNIKMQAMTIE